MTDELVDSEGYPRADIDVLTVRKTRVRIICKSLKFEPHKIFNFLLHKFESRRLLRCSDYLTYAIEN